MRFDGLRAMTTALVGLLGLAAAGCWEDAESIQAAVWSDDDTSQAYVHLYFEQSSSTNPMTGQHNTRNHRHQLFVQSANGSGRRAVTGERPGAMGTAFYYMKRAGYLLIEVDEEGQATRWDVVRLSDGHAQTLARRVPGTEPASPCEQFDAIPSPDGSTIAVLERTAPSNTPSGCLEGQMTVRFVDPDSLSTTATYSWAVEGVPGAVWTAAGDLRVWSYRDGAWSVAPATGPTPAAEPSCTQQVTSSSNVSSDGVVITPGEPEGQPVRVVSTSGDSCF